VDVVIYCYYGYYIIFNRQIGFKKGCEMGIDYSDEIKYNEYILEEIETSYDSNKIVPFIGSGFSKNANKDYPDWSQFIDYLSEILKKKKYYLKEKFSGTEYLIRAADYFSASKYHKDFPNMSMRNGREVLRGYIHYEIDKKLSKIQATDLLAHKLLLNLEKCNVYFTTNWDILIEKVAKEENIDIETIIDYSNLINIAQNGSKKILIKMHGSIGMSYKNNIIVSETDYFELSHNKNHPINIKFQNELFHKDFLFFGFSFTDPNISNLTFPAYLIKKEKFTAFNEPKIFLISFGDYDPVLAKFFIELRGIYLLFLDVPKTKYKHSIIAFLEYLTGSNDNIKKIINKTNDTYKTEMKDELSESVTTINEKIGLFSSNKDNPDYSLRIKNQRVRI